MIILIAESKTMDDKEQPIEPAYFEHHTPAGEALADKIMAEVARMTAPEIAAMIKISGTLAAKVTRMAYEFPNKSLGMKAIEAFTGVVFKELDYPTLPATGKDEFNDHVRIISSLYGWLKPEDIIKPYRFDFTTKIPPKDKALYEMQRKDVTIQLVRSIKESGDSIILNLLPADAAKCIDWKLVKNFAKVYKADFKELTNGGDWRRPHAGKLKALRGYLLREMIINGINDPESLKLFESEKIAPSDTPDYPDSITFLC